MNEPNVLWLPREAADTLVITTSGPCRQLDGEGMNFEFGVQGHRAQEPAVMAHLFWIAFERKVVLWLALPPRISAEIRNQSPVARSCRSLLAGIGATEYNPLSVNAECYLPPDASVCDASEPDTQVSAVRICPLCRLQPHDTMPLMKGLICIRYRSV